MNDKWLSINVLSFVEVGRSEKILFHQPLLFSSITSPKRRACPVFVLPIPSNGVAEDVVGRQSWRDCSENPEDSQVWALTHMKKSLADPLPCLGN